MSIQVHCSCGHELSVSQKYSGFKIPCPACGNPLAIKQDSSTSAGDDSAPTRGLPKPTSKRPTTVEDHATATKDHATATKDRPTATKDRPTASKPAASPTHVRTTCTCGKTLTVSASLAGRKANCPACGKQVTFPGGAAEPRRLIAFSCECGRKMRAPVKWSGKKTKCPACQSSVTIPAAEAPVRSGKIELSAANSPEDRPKPDLSGLLDEIGAHECKKSRRCPNCKNDMERDDVLCIECGYNVRTGKLIETDDAHRKSMLEVMRGWLGES